MKTRWTACGAFILLITVPLQGWAARWADLLDAATRRSPEARGLAAQAPVLQAKQVEAHAWWPQGPALSVSHRTDQWQQDEGLREWEVELEAPLWRHGQRQSQQQQVDAEQALLEHQTRMLQWELAGKLRERVWQLAEQAALHTAGEARVATAQALEKDVVRRVQAGELAEADALLARSETLAARNALAEVEAQRQLARQRLQMLTGTTELPAPLEETPSAVTDVSAILQAHPRMQWATHRRSVTQAEVQVARQAKPPVSAALLWAQERDALEDDDRQSVGVKLTLALGPEARQRSALAQARAGAIEADAQTDLVAQQITQDIEFAQWALNNARQQRQQAEQQVAAAQQSLVLSRRAFDVGELDLPSLLRLQQATREAKETLEIKQIESHRAVARLNQALGVLP